MKKQYRNVIKTKQQIQEALMAILNKKRDLTLISITDIIKYANISRSTFYNHYKNIMDVVNEIEEDLIQKLTLVLEESAKVENSVKLFINTVTTHIKENESVYSVIVPYVPKYIIENMKKRFIKQMIKVYPPKDNTAQQLIAINIIANGIAGIYMDYFENKINISLDSIAKYSIEFLENIQNNFLKNNV